MSVSYKSQIPSVVAKYFGVDVHSEAVTLAEVYSAESVATGSPRGAGWRKPYNARVSLRKLRAMVDAGATVFSFAYGDRNADFNASELFRTGLGH